MVTKLPKGWALQSFYSHIDANREKTNARAIIFLPAVPPILPQDTLLPELVLCLFLELVLCLLYPFLDDL